MSDRKSEIIKELESHIKEVEGLHYTKIAAVNTKIAAVNNLVNSAYRAKRELDSPRIVRTVKELEALELEDADAVVLTGQGGAVWTARVLAAMYRLGNDWCLPTVVLATGAQVRAAREAMEQEHG